MGHGLSIQLLLLIRVVFTDLNKDEVSRTEGRIWLVCNVVGDGNYQVKFLLITLLIILLTPKMGNLGMKKEN